MAHILDLPDELLLEIGSYLDGGYRHRDLANLSLVCRRFRGVAQEKLICQPSFHLKHLHNYVWELGCRHRLIPRIKSLEVFSSSEDRPVQPALSGPRLYIRIPGARTPHKPDYPSLPYRPSDFANKDGMIEECKQVIRYYTEDKSPICKALWLAALERDVFPALLSVLLCILTNLEEVKLGATWLMDFPMFSSSMLKSRFGNKPEVWSYGHLWMDPIADILRDKVRALEFPAEFTDMDFGFKAALFTFKDFRHLEYLSLPWHILFWYDKQRLPRPPTDPRTVFPKTLRVLRISECRETTANFLNELCMWKKRGFFPKLQRIELYFKWDLWRVAAHLIARRCPDVKEMENMCKDAKIALSHYWPPQNHTMFTHRMRRTPWNSLEERSLFCERCILAPYGMCFDAEGDTIMSGDEYFMWRGTGGLPMGHEDTKS